MAPPAMSRDIALNPASDDASPRFSPGLLRRFHPWCRISLENDGRKGSDDDRMQVAGACTPARSRLPRYPAHQQP